MIPSSLGSDGSIPHGGPIGLFPDPACVSKAVVCVILSGMMHIKERLLLIGKSSPCDGSGFPLSEWSFTICPTPYKQK